MKNQKTLHGKKKKDRRASIRSKKKRNRFWKDVSFAILMIVIGLINCSLWLFVDYPANSLIEVNLKDLNLATQGILFGRLYAGVLEIVVGLFGMFMRKKAILLIEGMTVVIVGGWVLGLDLLAVPALKTQGLDIEITSILRSTNKIWILASISQMMGGFFILWNYGNK